MADERRRESTESAASVVAGAVRVPLDDVDVAAPEPEADLVAVDDALEKLAAIDPRKARVVELRFFGGLSVEETAQALELSPRTVHKEWAFARAWRCWPCCWWPP